jgi:hypothetical protein
MRYRCIINKDYYIYERRECYIYIDIHTFDDSQPFLIVMESNLFLPFFFLRKYLQLN